MSKIIPIFDSLSHPSLDGSWVSTRGNGQNSFPEVISEMQKAGVHWAWAVSMGTDKGYDPTLYPKACTEADIVLLPAAFARPSDFCNDNEVEDWVIEKREQGFRGIKLHPRIGDFDFRHPRLPSIITAANRQGLIPFICTYLYSSNQNPSHLTTESVRMFLHSIFDQKLVLLHGGGAKLLEFAEITRHFRKVMLDISWTMCEYANSSVELDLVYVLDRCRHRVCIGSDSPDFSPGQMRIRFEKLTESFSIEHREQIAFRNLLAYSGLDIL